MRFRAQANHVSSSSSSSSFGSDLSWLPETSNFSSDASPPMSGTRRVMLLSDTFKCVNVSIARARNEIRAIFKPERSKVSVSGVSSALSILFWASLRGYSRGIKPRSSDDSDLVLLLVEPEPIDSRSLSSSESSSTTAVSAKMRPSLDTSRCVPGSMSCDPKRRGFVQEVCPVWAL